MDSAVGMAENGLLPSGEQQQPVLSRTQTEGVLHDVLEQLDRERAKRAEVEAQMRKLSEKLKKQQAAAALTQQPEQQQSISRHSFVAMEAQVKGFRDIVDALTVGKPAIAAAASQASNNKENNNHTLPLHVVRLLEVMPWDPRTQEHIFGHENLYEWQIYDEREAKWQNHMRYFPTLFKTLPIVRPDGGGGQIQEDNDGSSNNKDRPLLVFLAGDKKAARPSKHGLLTNDKMTAAYNIEDGYPLPQDGAVWEWIGGWRVDKHVKPATTSTDSLETLLCDENGWSYAFEPQDFLTDTPGAVSCCIGESLDNDEIPTGPKRSVRRRKWTRRRVLVSYPLASERTLQYLKVIAENARLSITASKISEQLVQTKMALTETEDKLEKTKAALQKQEELLRAIGVDDIALNGKNDGDGVNPLQDFLSKNEQVKDIGSKITQWVKSARKTSEDLTSDETVDTEEATNGTRATTEETTPHKFPWKKLGRGGLIEKLARPSPGTSRTGLRLRANSNGSSAALTLAPTTANAEEGPVSESVGVERKS